MLGDEKLYLINYFNNKFIVSGYDPDYKKFQPYIVRELTESECNHYTHSLFNINKIKSDLEYHKELKGQIETKIDTCNMNIYLQSEELNNYIGSLK